MFLDDNLHNSSGLTGVQPKVGVVQVDQQLKLLAGGRYDRSYNDPAIIKYDRLMPEGWIDQLKSFMAGLV